MWWIAGSALASTTPLGLSSRPAAPVAPEATATPEDRCNQPDLFDPGKTPLPEGAYEVRSTESWLPKFAAPWSLRVFSFPCPNESTDVLEFSKDGVRKALFTHVEQFVAEGQRLYLVNTVHEADGWRRHQRIVDIETMKKVEIPASSCTGTAFWERGMLWTWAPGNTPTEACLWDAQGKLVYHLVLTEPDSNVGRGSVGRLPLQPEVVYHVDPIACAVELLEPATGRYERRILATAEELADTETFGMFPCTSSRSWVGALSTFTWRAP